MPHAPARPCKQPGCPGKVRSRGRRYCGEHDHIQVEHDKERWRRADERRGSAQERGYDATWQRVREAYLSRVPMCEHCMASGVIAPATVVHHRDENPRNNHVSNLASLCRDCHEREHGRLR